MKTQIRVLGIDDAPFKFGDKNTGIVGAVVRVPSYLEGVMIERVSVDGDDATETIAEMIIRSRFREQLKLVLVDGVAVGGFNIVDIRKLHQDVNVPVVTITRDKPDFDEIKSALKEHFEDWELRYELITSIELKTVETAHRPLHVGCEGIDIEEASEIIRMSTVRGAIPEPVRIAHIIASALKSGESHGRA